MWVGKIEVARRQIIEAVRLFFGQRDPIAIHTVIAAAHQILVDLGNKRGAISSLKKSTTEHHAAFKEYVRRVNYPYNFLKHADTDPDATFNIGPLLEFSSDFIMDAIWMLQQVAHDIPIEAKVFWFWFVSKYAEGFNDLPQDSEIKKMQEARLADWDFPKISRFIEFAYIVKDAHL